jgi:hypothetical protein
VDARTLYADIRRDLSKAEAAKTADLHAPFGSIQDRSFNVTHEHSCIYLLVDSPSVWKSNAFRQVGTSRKLLYR